MRSSFLKGLLISALSLTLCPGETFSSSVNEVVEPIAKKTKIHTDGKGSKKITSFSKIPTEVFSKIIIPYLGYDIEKIRELKFIDKDFYRKVNGHFKEVFEKHPGVISIPRYCIKIFLNKNSYEYKHLFVKEINKILALSSERPIVSLDIKNKKLEELDEFFKLNESLNDFIKEKIERIKKQRNNETFIENFQNDSILIDGNFFSISLELDGYQEYYDKIQIMDTIKSLPQKGVRLHSLYLVNNYLGVEGAKHLGIAIKEHKTLHTLNLGYNDIGDEGARHIAEGIKDLKSLRNLSLAQNNIQNEGAKHLSETIKSFSFLKNLGLVYNNIDAEGVIYIGTAIKNLSSLESLYLGGGNIGSKGIEHIAEGIKKNRLLKNIGLINSKIDNDGAKKFSELIKNHKFLEKLHLSGNSIEIEGAKCIAKAIKNYNFLQTLNLNDNSIGTEGAKCIVESIKNHKLFKELCLKSNRIGSDAAFELIKKIVLAKNSSIKYLNLECNNINKEIRVIIRKLIKGDDSSLEVKF
jgi:Ran GTPase-activating protein (RanGAP) involved in mRNA processing and transport